MPEMTLLGWFHTILGIVAVLSGFYTLYKYKVISAEESSGRLYIWVTLLVAGSALGIYNQGGFGVAHILAVLTLMALLKDISWKDSSCLVLFRNTFKHLDILQPSYFI